MLLLIILLLVSFSIGVYLKATTLKQDVYIYQKIQFYVKCKVRWNKQIIFR